MQTRLESGLEVSTCAAVKPVQLMNILSQVGFYGWGAGLLGHESTTSPCNR